MNDFKNSFLSKLGAVAEKAKDVAAKTADSTKDLASKAGDKAKQLSKIAKLNIEIGAEKDTIKKAYAEIGKLYYEAHKNDAEGYFAQLCDEITLSIKNIEEKEAEIADLKANGAEDEDDSFEVEFEEIPAEAEVCCDEEEAPCSEETEG